MFFLCFQVTFLLTDVEATRRRRRSSQGVIPRVIGQSDAQLYRDLAQGSGGQTIEVTKSDLSLATSVIEDSSAGAVVRHQTSKSSQDKEDTACIKCKASSLRSIR